MAKIKLHTELITQNSPKFRGYFVISKMNVKGILKEVKKLKGIGVYKTDREIRLFFLRESKNNILYLATSTDGENFSEIREIGFYDSRKRKLNIQSLSSIRAAVINKKIISVSKFKNGLTSSVYIGSEERAGSLTNKARVIQISETAGIVSDYKYKGKYVAYCGGDNIRILTSGNLTKWHITKNPVLTLNENGHIEIGTVEKINNGILIIYFEAVKGDKGKLSYSIRAAIFDDKNPEKRIINTAEPIWEEPGEWNNLNINIRPFGLVTFGESIISYWELDENEIVAVIHKKRAKIHRESVQAPDIFLKKHHKNPILRPIRSNYWESKGTFNPAAIYDEGKIHIIYRAIGDSDMSMLGYASSRDGIHIDERLSEPIYVATAEPGLSAQGRSTAQIPLSAYASGGGGYGGVEDPRITRIGDKYYMTYVAYDGMNPPRVALTSIKRTDFHKKEWKWQKPVIISKPNIVDKNAVIFPEKINGKYCIMHRIFPDILIDFVDSLDFDDNTYLQGEFKISPRRNYWDSRKIGAGAPPIKTESGWLLIYQGVGDQDSSRYKIGAMLLDLKDPTKVTARAERPILQPEEEYENEGLKYGVVYPCGSVILKDELLVYYGGADMVTCVAKSNLNSFLSDLTYHSVGTLRQVHI